jgi:hypothetical protein
VTTDDKGASSEDTVAITVKAAVAADTVAPVITLKGADKIYHYLNPDYPDDNPYVDQGATALDDVDGELAVTQSGNVLNALGTYTISYKATDAAHNEATKARIVKVVDVMPVYAEAGSEQTTMELKEVTLNGSYSGADTDNGYEIISYEWKQTKGTPVSLTNANSAMASFIAPDISVTETLEFTLTVADPSGFTASAATTVKVTPLLSATPISTGRVNDTGLTSCGDDSSNQLPCPVATHPNQDAENGRDVTADDNLDGYKGFSFTKLDNNGVPLADQAADYATTPWSCVKDNVSGLVWEVKTRDGGLHDVSSTFSALPEYSNATNCHLNGSDCTTVNYVAAANEAGFCNANDWRLPTLSELFDLTLLESNVMYDQGISVNIDTNYFPNIIRAADNINNGGRASYWTSDIPYIQNQRYYNYFVNFTGGGDFKFLYQHEQFGVILVRGTK